MFWKIYVFKLITFHLIRIALSENETQNGTCSYDHTVDLTGLARHANGSYFYGKDEIPSEFVHFYNNHLRGCICSVKRCLHICSHRLVDFYNSRDDKGIIDYGFIKDITLNDGTIKQANLINDFHLVVKSVSKPRPIVPQFSDQWTLFENLSLLRHMDGFLLRQGEYCFDISIFDENDEWYFLVNPYYGDLSKLPWIITTHGNIRLFGTMFLVATIVWHVSLNKLNNVYNKCLMTYLSSLALSYSLIMFLSIFRVMLSSVACKIIGYSIYFTCLSYLTWNCVLSYYTWSTLTHMKDGCSSFRKYALVGWLSPLFMTLLTSTTQIFFQSQAFMTNSNETICGVHTYTYLLIPGTLVFIFSLKLYIKVLRYIMTSKREVCANIEEKSTEIRFFLYLRLFILMGVSWLFEVLSYIAHRLSDWKSDARLPDVISGAHGFLIFLVFIWRSNVWSKIRKILK